MPDEATNEAREQAARDVAGAQNPTEALAAALPTLSPPAALHLIDSVFHRLPAYPGIALLRAIAAVHEANGHPEAALLTGGMADQLSPVAPARGAGGSAATSAILSANPEEMLLRFVAAAEHDPAQIWLLVSDVWPHLPPLSEYWIAFRAAQAFGAAGMRRAEMVLAALALQLDPAGSRSQDPMERLLDGLLAGSRLAAAGALALEWHALLGPERTSGTVRRGIQAASLTAPLPPAVRLGPWRILHAAEPVPPAPAEIAAAHPRFMDLTRPDARAPVRIVRLTDVEVAVEHDHVAICRGDGQPISDWWIGLPSRVVASRAANAPVIARRRAVLVSDTFPSPNYCHFLCDQVTRLTLYRQAGVDLATVAVIGARLAQPFQHEIAERFGAGEWIATDRPRRIRVAELWVVSTCADNQHPAHVGAKWARTAIRTAFSVHTALPGGKRLYVSRADASVRKVANEAALIERLTSLGFDIVAPGTMTVAEQAARFAQASHVVGLHGAGMTNVVFCPPGTSVLELLHPYYATNAFAVLSRAGGLDYRAMAGCDGGDPATAPNNPHDVIDWIGRDVWIDIDAVAAWAANTNR